MVNDWKMELWPVKRFVPYARNPRKNDHAIDRMVAAIQEFGFAVPLLARRSGEIIDGHLRFKAAQKLRLRELPVILCDDWSEAQVRAFRLNVNRSATWAEWDEDLVMVELADLKALDFDLSLTGFDLPEIDRYLFPLDADDSTELDAVLPLATQAVAAAGDLWVCGPHRVLCGDSTSLEAVSRLLASRKPLLMVTDPPYGVALDPLWRQRAGLGAQRQIGAIPNDDRADWTAAYRLFAGSVAYVWHAGVHAAEVARGLIDAGFEIRAQLIWAKQHFALGRGDYHWGHEPCWYAVRKGQGSHWCGDRTQSTLWQVPNMNPFGGGNEEITGHGTQKPVELMRRAILNHTQRGEMVYDPFLGSGTTLIAAERTERICYGLEIAPQYVDMIVRRWQDLSGQEALLDGGGRTFQQIQAERQPPASTGEI